MKNKWYWIIVIIFLIIFIIWAVIAGMWEVPQELTWEQVQAMRNSIVIYLPNQTPVCKGTARCFTGTVTRIVDGDTLYVNNNSIRLALVNASEYKGKEGKDATEFVSSICPVGSTALVDEDDGQTEGSYGRIVAVVYCNGTDNNLNINLNLIYNRYATMYEEFCNVSEFANEEWVKVFGC
jgi:micrococcal nuclease